MLNALLKDPIARLVIGVWSVVTVLLFIPILPAPWLHAYADNVLELPFLALVLLAIGSGFRQIEDDVERRFWRLIGIGAFAWLTVALPYGLAHAVGRWTIGWQIFGDLCYLAGYLALVLAIETQPHRQHTGTLSERERQLRTFGLVVLACFLLAYFVLIPAAFSGSNYESEVPTYDLFIVLDCTIVTRLLMSRRDAWSIRWSWVYTWLIVAGLVTLMSEIGRAHV